MDSHISAPLVPSDLASSQERMRCFIQEATVAVAFNAIDAHKGE